MKFFLSIASLLMSQIVYSFEYQIDKPILRDQSTPAHESITSLALDCADKFNDSNVNPSNCLGEINLIQEYTTKTGVLIPSISNNEISAISLLNASSWPDDPTRQGSYYGAKAKINLSNECSYFWSFLGYEDYSDSIAGGLFCNSHFGALQFFHTQASKPSSSEKYTNEPYEITKQKTLAWIMLNYDIINDKSILSEPYCDYFNTLKTKDDTVALAEAFLPTTHEDSLLQCKENYNIDWIYSNKCTKLTSSKKCTKIGTARDHQIVALGAIIHAIQDSYSLSHTKRGACSNGNNKPVSKTICKPIEQYYSYSVQDSEKHGESDKLPITIDASCSSNEIAIDDIVTATANIIWHAKHAKDKQVLKKYLVSSVFYDPYITSNPPKNGPDADAGNCYK